MKEKNCPYCSPYKSKLWHWPEKTENLFFYLQLFFSPLVNLIKKNHKIYSFLKRAIFYNFFRLLLLFGIFKEVKIKKNSSQFHNRILVVVREAEKRNIPIKVIKFLGKNINFFSILINGKKDFFEGLPGLELDRVFKIDFDDKYKLKQVLKENNLPVPQGEKFYSKKKALKYIDKIEFPVVVKPRSGSLSKHTICNIKNKEKLEEAIKIAKQISFEFIIEKFIEGDLHRVTLVDRKMAACCKKTPANIVGDGIHTIKELIDNKNSDPKRGEINQKNYSLHKIKITEETPSLLKKQNLRLGSVLKKNQKLYLSDKIILAAGADIIDKTNEVHLENKKIFQKVAEFCGAPLLGLDFICQDVKKPYFEQRFGIIEANSLPYIDMHHYPSDGEKQNVASVLLDFKLKSDEI